MEQAQRNRMCIQCDQSYRMQAGLGVVTRRLCKTAQMNTHPEFDKTIPRRCDNFRLRAGTLMDAIR